MKTLVTGCAGFIGSNLTDYLLDNGISVVGIDCFSDYYSRQIKESNLSHAREHSKFTFLEQDLLKIDVFPENVDYVFHLAAQAGVRASWDDNFHTYTKNNIEATQRLLEFYKDRELEKFVYSSSSSVYGDVDLPMNEESVLKPVSPYGVSKLAGEHLTYLYWKNYGVPTVSLRYFTVYGPRQRPDMAINIFTRSLLEGQKILLYGDGEQTRDFTYVDDVVQSNILAARSDLAGEVFNIGGGNQVTVNDLIHHLEKTTGKRAKVKKLGKQRGDMKNTLADVSKVKKFLKWYPQVQISEGLEKYVEWLKEK